jgi:hypothetical protein
MDNETFKVNVYKIEACLIDVNHDFKDITDLDATIENISGPNHCLDSLSPINIKKCEVDYNDEHPLNTNQWKDAFKELNWDDESIYPFNYILDGLEVRGKIKDDEIHTEIVAWITENSCITLAYWQRDSEGYHLKYVGDRPFQYDIGVFQKLAEYGQDKATEYYDSTFKEDC